MPLQELLVILVERLTVREERSEGGHQSLVWNTTIDIFGIYNNNIPLRQSHIKQRLLER